MLKNLNSRKDFCISLTIRLLEKFRLSLRKLTLEFLGKNNMDDIPIIVQSYDGASVMSGKNNGLQRKSEKSILKLFINIA